MTDLEKFEEIVANAQPHPGWDATISSHIHSERVEVPDGAEGIHVRVSTTLAAGSYTREFPNVVLVFDRETGRLKHSYGCEPDWNNHCLTW